MNRDFPCFTHMHLLSSDLFSSELSRLSDSSLLCFSSVHIVGSLASKLPSIKVYNGGNNHLAGDDRPYNSKKPSCSIITHIKYPGRTILHGRINSHPIIHYRHLLGHSSGLTSDGFRGHFLGETNPWVMVGLTNEGLFLWDTEMR